MFIGTEKLDSWVVTFSEVLIIIYLIKCLIFDSS
jgi:hypothetical protein